MSSRDELLNGFKNFREQYYCKDGLMPQLFHEGQNPSHLFIHCMDSRSNPADLLQTEPGTFFDHAPMGAIVPPYSENDTKELKAKLSYALDHADISNIVVLGHSRCGAIAALCCGLEDENITPWLNVAKKGFELAKSKVGEDDQEALMRETEQQVVKMSVENLLDYPVVKKAVAEGRLNVEGWLFKMQKGNLLELDQETGEFTPLTTFGTNKDPKNDTAQGDCCCTGK